jgi:squalene-hopene/tetraprenyl-beta-curcumene cyclase
MVDLGPPPSSYMNRNAQRLILLALLLLLAITLYCWHTSTRAAGGNHLKPIAASWNPKAAAAYLDQRQAWWMDWPKAARDHDTFCISCHTAVPYALARPALRSALGEEAPSANERRLLDNVRKRVRLWKEVEPFYSDADRGAYKTVESRGTESVLNAFILASNDARTGQLSADTRSALANMWAEQQTTGTRKGAWQWLRFANEPWEADDSDYYGATLAAIAAGSAPGNYLSTPAIQKNLDMLRDYLNRERAAQPAFNRVVLLWAAAKLPGMLQAEQRRAIIDEVLAKQQADGGWSLSSLAGGWKRHDGTPQETGSDGYATGLVTFALQQVGISRDNAPYQRGVAWLESHQSNTEGFWPSYSLNKSEKNHLSPDTALFMKDAATAYAVLALSESGGGH